MNTNKYDVEVAKEKTKRLQFSVTAVGATAIARLPEVQEELVRVIKLFEMLGPMFSEDPPEGLHVFVATGDGHD